MFSDIKKKIRRKIELYNFKRNHRGLYVDGSLQLRLALIYIICPSFWNGLTGLSTDLMVLMLIGFFVAPAYDFWLARQRYEYKYKLAGSLTAITALLASLCAVMIVLHMNAKELSDVANGRLYASNIVSYIVYGILWFIIIFRGKTFFNKEYWKFSLQLSIPLIGYALAAQVLSVSDRMMISRMVDNSAVGIYSTLYTVSSISLLVWSAINASFIPYLYQNIESDKNEIKKYSLLLMGAYAIVAALLTFFAPEIVRTLATEEYYEAIYIMPPIAGGVFLTCVSNMYSNIMIYYKKTQYIMDNAKRMAEQGIATVFGYYVRDPERFGVVEFDSEGKVLSVEEKPKAPKSNYAITGLYFYPSGVASRAERVKPSSRGELEITTLNDMYLKDNLLNVELLNRGFAWLDTGTMESLLRASDFIHMVEEQQGVMISAPEEIAYRYKWITTEQLKEAAALYGKSPYGEHLKIVAEGKMR